jgi:hypothetical protein
VPLGPIVVAGELDAVALAELLLDLDERFGLSAAPAGGLPVVRLAALGDKSDGSRLGIDGLDPVTDPGARPALLGLAERDDVAGLVAGGEPGLGAGKAARLQDTRDHGVLAERAVHDERGADGFGQFLPALAGRVEHEGPAALLAGQACEVAGEDGLASLSVGLLDDASADVVDQQPDMGFSQSRVSSPQSVVDQLLELGDRLLTDAVLSAVELEDQNCARSRPNCATFWRC